MGEAAHDLMYALVLENGRLWGDAAIEIQREDAAAVFSDSPPYKHFITRPRGGSKPLALDTPIPTPSGWTTMGEIQVGDSVFDAHGVPTVVTHVGEVLIGEPCYRVEFTDGEPIVASADHEWLVEDHRIIADGGSDYLVTVTTESMRGHLYYGSGSALRWRIRWRISRDRAISVLLDVGVSGIIPVSSVPVRCIRVASPSHLYLAGRSAIPTHNSSDLAGITLSWLATEAPARSNGRVVASNADQASILIEAAASFVARTPELEGVIKVEAERLVAPNGAYIRILSQSDSGSWGLRDCRFLICDEFAQWPETRAAKRVYSAIRSTVQKVDGCKLIVITSSGEPSHWYYQGVYLKAKNDSSWRVSEMPGPVPWQSPEELASLKRDLSPSEYLRLVMNIAAQDEERAISEQDYEVANVLYGSLHPREGVKYVITVDIGLYHDATVMCVAHKEPIDPENNYGPQRVVIDHLERWKGTRAQPVQVQDVEDWLVRQATLYNMAEVYYDPNQFRGAGQNLNRRGVRAKEWEFTVTSVGKVASALVQLFRNRLIWLYGTRELREELLSVRLKETAPGVTRLDHDRTGHDDQAVAIGMAGDILLGKGAWGMGAAWMEAMKRDIAAEEAMDDPERRKRAIAMSLGMNVPMLGQEAPPGAASSIGCKHTFRGLFKRCIKCGTKMEEAVTVN